MTSTSWTRVSETLDSRGYFQSWVCLLACIAAVLLVGTKAAPRRHASAPQPLAPAHADESIGRAHAGD
jgi:hypothetical protein